MVRVGKYEFFCRDKWTDCGLMAHRDNLRFWPTELGNNPDWHQNEIGNIFYRGPEIGVSFLQADCPDWLAKRFFHPFGPIRQLKFLGLEITVQKQAKNPRWEGPPTEISDEPIILGTIYRLVRKFGRRPSGRGFWAYFWSEIFDPKFWMDAWDQKGYRKRFLTFFQFSLAKLKRFAFLRGMRHKCFLSSLRPQTPLILRKI